MTSFLPDEKVTTDEPALRRPFGWQLRLQLAGCRQSVVNDMAQVETFATLLCDAIGMTPYGGPIVDRFGVGDLYGITAVQQMVVQRLTTSAMVIHCDPPDGVFIDVFSCRWFDPQAAADFSVRYFTATGAAGDFSVRQAPPVGFVYNFGT
jgi:S-adenosylmethionine/arginine decarboxylase-like enzyme